MTYSRDNIDVTYSKMLRYKRELTCRLERKLTKKEFSTAIGIDQEYLEKTQILVLVQIKETFGGIIL